MTESECLSIGEIARRVGISVRTLRFYEQKGLLQPIRAANGRRYFPAAELQRLQHILVLKSIGLSLNEIADLLAQKEIDAANLLAMQIDTLIAQRESLDAVLMQLESAKADLPAGGALDIPTLCDLITATRSLEMENPYKDIIEKYYTQEQLDRLSARAPTPEEQAQIQQQWANLIARVNRLRADGTDPTSPEAQAAATEWQGLINAFTGGDPEIEASLKRMYADQENWPGDVESPVDPEVAAYIQKALAAMRE